MCCRALFVLQRIVFVVLWLFFVGFVTDKAEWLAGSRSDIAKHNCNIVDTPEYPYVTVVIPDVGLQLASLAQVLDWQSLPIPLPNIVLIIFACSIFLFIVRHDRWMLMVRVAWLYGWLLMLRNVTINVTNYPPLGKHCVDYEPQPFVWWHNALFLYPSCGDFMFSGHTTLFVLVAWMHTLFPIFKNNFLRMMFSLILWLLVLFGVFTLLGKRYHYSSDILIAGVITSQSVFLYHWWLDRMAAARSANGFIAWLEADFFVAMEGNDHEYNELLNGK